MNVAKPMLAAARLSVWKNPFCGERRAPFRNKYMAQPGRLLPADLAQRPNFDAAEQKTVSATDDDRRATRSDGHSRRAGRTIEPHRPVVDFRLKEVSPAAIGISRGRWNNVRALPRAALALVQPISPAEIGTICRRSGWRYRTSYPRDRTKSRYRGYCISARRTRSTQARSPRKPLTIIVAVWIARFWKAPIKHLP